MKNKLELYIHIPFCIRKCNYCDFLSAPADEETKRNYVSALIREIQQSSCDDALVDTIFIGGGTPSILEAEQMEEILASVRENFHICENAEITIECNPGTVTEEKLLTYKKCGVNRISFGLQSANDEELRSLGRIHSYEEFLESYELARKCGFDNINIDLMSALPGQTVESYEETVQKVLALNPEHISAYSLIVEEGTALKQRLDREGYDCLPSEDDERSMYYRTEQLLKEAGYHRYEISNYAKDGFSCRHNIGYWKRKEYMGFGLGAASLIGNWRYNNTSDFKCYMNAQDFESVRVNQEMLSLKDQMAEFMFLGLRMMEGISIEEFRTTFQTDLYAVYGDVMDKFIKQELLVDNKERIYLTPKGIDVSNYVMAEFLLEN
ncbi:MAG: radical SAM family heme chaperone HemW [Eubacterium sp.]|nr:radical SAM family heme chaperone HemW [Eubacterium sp.]